MASTLLNNIISYFKCDVNGSFPDELSTNNGTIVSATFNASGKINGEYDYDGINDEITFSSSVLSTGSKSLNFWCQSNDNSFQVFMANGQAESGNLEGFGVLTFGTGAIQINLGNGVTGGQYVSVTSNATNIVNGARHMISFTFDGTNARLFVDGVFDTSAIASGTESAPTGNLRIGNEPVGLDRFYTGSFDEIGFWSRDLTFGGVSVSQVAGGEIAEIYALGAGNQFPFGVDEDNALLFGTNQ